MSYSFHVIKYFYKIKLYYWGVIIQLMTCTIGFEWGPSRCAVEVNHMCGGNWIEITELCHSMLMNIFSVHWLDFLSLSSTFTHRLIKVSSILFDSYIAHKCTFTNLTCSLQSSSQSYAHSFIFVLVSLTPHRLLQMSVTRGRSVGSKETKFTEYKIAHMPSMHK